MDKIRGLTNYGPIAIPETSVVAYFGVWDHSPNTWIYSLWTNPIETGGLVSTNTLTLPENVTVTPEQVARIAFILDVEHAPEKINGGQ